MRRRGRVLDLVPLGPGRALDTRLGAAEEEAGEDEISIRLHPPPGNDAAAGPERPRLDRPPELRARATVVLLAAVLVSLGLAAAARADRTFAPRFSTDTTGRIAMIANTLLTCSPVPNCASAQQGTTESNNDFTMQYVNVDPDGGNNFDSSSADLSLPAGDVVLFAGLYWEGDTRAGGGGHPPPDAGAADTVRFRAPDGAGYRTMTASTLDQSSVSGNGDYFQGFVDVTGIVSAAGNGTYTVANVQSATGNNKLGGWALVMAVQDTSLPPRNMTILDGFKAVSSGSPGVSGSLTGFETPPSGPVNTVIGVVSNEGDAGLTGDTASLDGVKLSDALNSANNFFDSAISFNGVRFTDKAPDYANQLGFDAKLVDANGILPNGATSASTALTTSGDTYVPGVVTFQTDLFAPEIESDKTQQNLDNPGGDYRPGDRIQYTIRLTNTGLDGADNVVLQDPIPANSSYVPGSLEQTAVATNTASCPGSFTGLTDGAGDDTAEFNGTDQRVVFRLGQGASATDGGLLPTNPSGEAGTTQCIHFTVQIDPDAADQTTIVNQGEASFFGQSLGTPLSDLTPITTATVHTPDLTITKTHTGDLTGGTTVPYTLIVSNVGHLTSSGTTTVTDTFDATNFTSISSAAGTGWGCTIAGLTVTCSRADALAAGASFPPITIDAVLVGAPGAVVNTAHVDNPSDSNPSNNASTDIGPGVSVADVAITKQADPDTVQAGQPTTFTLVASNAGPSDADDVTVDDPVAPNFTEVSVATSEGSCTTAVSCSLGTLPAGAAATITIVAVPTTTAAATVTNTATISTSTDENGQTANDTDSADVTVTPAADLSVTKTGPTNANAGDQITWTLQAANNGPSAATNAVLYDLLPLAVDPTTATVTGATCTLGGSAGRLLTCPFGTVASGASTTITVTATLRPGTGGQTILNGTLVDSDTNDPDRTNNTDIAHTFVMPAADLEMSKTAPGGVNEQPPPPADVGDVVPFTMTVTNHGPSDSPDATVTDTLPAGLTFVSSTDTCAAAGQKVTCTRGTPLTAGATWTFTVDALVGPDAADSTITNTATASGPSPDPDPSNNDDRADVDVAPAVSLAVTKVAADATPFVDTDDSYTITVANQGPDPATGVVLSDSLPSGETFVSATASQGSCSAAGGAVTCSLGTIAVGGSVEITVTVHVGADTAGASITNTATTTANEHNTTPDQSSDSATIKPITPAPPSDAKLTVTKTVNPTRAPFGTPLKYTITITNAGPGTAATPTITDTFSGPVTIVSVHTSSGSCTKHNPITCHLGSIPPGGHVTITVVVRPKELGKLRNTASATTPTPLAPGSHTTDHADSTITPGPHSRIVLHDTTSTPKIPPGGTAIFRPKVTNPNPWPLHNVKVCDRLPSGTMFRLASRGARHSRRRVCWTVATLGPHASHASSARAITSASQPPDSRTFTVEAEALLGVTGHLRDAATTVATATGQRLTAHAHAQVLVVPTGVCRGSASDSAARAALADPLAVIAC